MTQELLQTLITKYPNHQQLGGAVQKVLNILKGQAMLQLLPKFVANLKQNYKILRKNFYEKQALIFMLPIIDEKIHSYHPIDLK